MTASLTRKVLVSGYRSHCDVINQTPQIRQIGYRSAVAVSSLAVSSRIVQIAADMPISDVRCRYWSDTSCNNDNDNIHILIPPCKVVTSEAVTACQFMSLFATCCYLSLFATISKVQA